jgi:Fur family transcriptional regulator, ferric uptake regulator
VSKRTAQREAIRTAIESAGRPLSPQEVLERAQRAVPGLGIATVYRALSSGADEGWLKPVQLATGPTRYERAGLHHHHHFRCRVCDRVYDLEGCPGNLKALLPPGFTIEEHEITLYGRCAKCTG